MKPTVGGVQVADVRNPQDDQEGLPLNLHAEEIPHLLAMPSLQFDTASCGIIRCRFTDARLAVAKFVTRFLALVVSVAGCGNHRTIA